MDGTTLMDMYEAQELNSVTEQFITEEMAMFGVDSPLGVPLVDDEEELYGSRITRATVMATGATAAMKMMARRRAQRRQPSAYTPVSTPYSNVRRTRIW